eukprot:RCo027353
MSAGLGLGRGQKADPGDRVPHDDLDDIFAAVPEDSDAALGADFGHSAGYPDESCLCADDADLLKAFCGDDDTARDSSTHFPLEYSGDGELADGEEEGAEPPETALGDLIGASLREPTAASFLRAKGPTAPAALFADVPASSSSSTSSFPVRLASQSATPGMKRVLRENANGEVDIVEVPREATEDSALHITSATYHSKRRKVKQWSEEETTSFMDLLQQYGCNFSVLETFFPSRTRAELKAKFKREEASNPTLLERTLRERRPIDIQRFKECKERTDAMKAAAAQL